MHIEISLQIKLRQETETEGPEATNGGNPWHGSQFYMYSINLNKIVLCLRVTQVFKHFETNIIAKFFKQFFHSF